MKHILCSIHVFTLNYGIQNNYKYVISRSRIINLLGNFSICFAGEIRMDETDFDKI
jgi:hypothetical protein